MWLDRLARASESRGALLRPWGTACHRHPPSMTSAGASGRLPRTPAARQAICSPQTHAQMPARGLSALTLGMLGHVTALRCRGQYDRDEDEMGDRERERRMREVRTN
eukprot:1036869-Rhodomonas_salina.2